MKKSEQILIGGAGLALVGYAIYALVGGAFGPSIVREIPPQETESVRAQISAELPNLGITDNERAGVESILRPWTIDPFYYREVKPEEKEEMEGEDPTLLFSYTGYIELGNRRLAIINDQEYQEGEALDIPGFRLNRIYPNRVLIDYDLRDTPVVIPYEDID